MLAASEKWRSAYPGAAVGVLAMSNVADPPTSPPLDAAKQALEAQLRADYSGLTRAQLKSHPMLLPYTEYFRRFDKSYHVQHQLESIVFKGKPIPRVAALVEAMFMAELTSLLLTAGHDLDTVRGQAGIDVATGSETYTTLAGVERSLKQGDMFIRDEVGVLSSILYGPDRRTQITPDTSHVMFNVYAPAGVAQSRIHDHLDNLIDLVGVVSPAATTEYKAVMGASSE